MGAGFPRFFPGLGPRVGPRAREGGEGPFLAGAWGAAKGAGEDPAEAAGTGCPLAYEFLVFYTQCDVQRV